ncbi:KpsF/GutQ family sugar-phosphate isomerase [Rhodomicrobium vannielii ATCC 17100]|uniref:KpsF/GutQ family sugar-phosphate isomerase n=1 Tax=Rhodomicrobium vannielii TaxID=1069 RepID=UPI00191B8496|nr:KpsF/GutQ family sugar-phosphate isomerase [Rhodomicrobium vannielii]MBJ7534223.1 KpsF/GutQ family sugar-phosphate isomerase [Rhodomicrobium vannielii ATCC 17100]
MVQSAARIGIGVDRIVSAGEALSEPGSAALVARRTLECSLDGLLALRASLANGLALDFERAVALIHACRGRVIVTGMGKSGHVGQKIAATLASTGTPAQFVHPAEASHGDLGMITAADTILALSWSGETVELASILTYSRRFRVPLIALTSRRESALGKAADVVLQLPPVKEACPHGLAPTTSTLTQLALGDCLAIALLEGRGFTASDFKVFHPGGQLGANLKHVADIMHKGERMPLAGADAPMSAALVTMTEKAFGCLGVVDAEGRLAGIVTDGDLRRHMAGDLLGRRAADIMTCNPKTITPTMLASAALQIVNEKKITALFVVEDGVPVGIVHIHDLLRVGVA